MASNNIESQDDPKNSNYLFHNNDHISHSPNLNNELNSLVGIGSIFDQALNTNDQLNVLAKSAGEIHGFLFRKILKEFKVHKKYENVITTLIRKYAECNMITNKDSKLLEDINLLIKKIEKKEVEIYEKRKALHSIREVLEELIDDQSSDLAILSASIAENSARNAINSFETGNNEPQYGVISSDFFGALSGGGWGVSVGAAVGGVKGAILGGVIGGVAGGVVQSAVHGS